MVAAVVVAQEVQEEVSALAAVAAQEVQVVALASALEVQAAQEVQTAIVLVDIIITDVQEDLGMFQCSAEP